MIPENKKPLRPCGRKRGLSHTIPIVRILWIFSVISVVFLSLSPKIHVPLEFRESDKIAHFIAYLWLAVLPFVSFSPLAARRCALLMVPLGIVLEFAQIVVPGRFFSFGDMLANFLGVVLGIWISRAVRKKLMQAESHNRSFQENRGKVLRKPTSTRPGIWLLEEEGKPAIMKDFSRNRFLYRNVVGRFLVWREGKAYRKLQGIQGIPALYRIVPGRALVFEAIPGTDMESFDKKEGAPESFFDALSHLVSLCHARGVAHCDLKRAPNTIFGDDGRPYIVDWAAAILREEFRIPPMNLIYRRFLRDDHMAVIKLKLRHRPETVTVNEKERYYYRSRGERVVRAVRDKLREFLQRAA